MFEIGYSEILVIGIVLIVVVGPKDLPKMLRAFGKTMTKFRQMSGDFQRQFSDALKEAELDDVRKTIADVRKLDPRQQVRDVFNPLRDAGNALKADLNKVAQTPVAPAMTAPITVADAKPVTPNKLTEKPAVKKIAKKTAKPDTSVSSASKPRAKIAVTKTKVNAPIVAAPTKVKAPATKSSKIKGKADK
jgi:sec-independent protein translocase protein TatB